MGKLLKMVKSNIYICRMAAEFPSELVATPIEDIDPFYSDKKVRLTDCRQSTPEIELNFKDLLLI